MSRLSVDLKEFLINSDVCLNSKAKFLHVDLSALGGSENLIEMAFRNPEIRHCMVNAANHGFHIYKHIDGISSFVHLGEIPKFWHLVKEQKLKHFNSLVYEISQPEIGHLKKRLLVVFSSMSDEPFAASISKRCFFKNFKSVNKFIPANTCVLRIVDIGGVVCGYYLNNNYNHSVENDVIGLINKIAMDNGVQDHRDIILYGASKGGTAALFHSINGGFQSVVVDPIVSDIYYEERHNDSHFTRGCFPETKQEKFAKLLNSDRKINIINIIYSERSPQFDVINSIVRSSLLGPGINFINSRHPAIVGHPDVSKMTLGIATSLINGMFYGFVKSNGLDYTDF